MKLYEYDNAILDCVDDETGEIIDVEKLEALQMEFDTKVESIACWYKELLAEAQALKEESKNLTARQKAKENKAQGLKEYLDYCLGGSKFETSRCKIGYRKSQAVQIDDVLKIPIQFLKYSEPTPDKMAIKNALKEGQEIDGATLVDNNNISIK